MTTFFARHTEQLDIRDEWVERLWTERRIAVHFPTDRKNHLRESDNSSTDPADHPRAGAMAMSRLNELVSRGGYVCAQYRGHEAVLIGKVRPGAIIEPFTAEWRSRSGRAAALKTVRLEMVREVDPLDHAVLLVGRPQRGTLTRWPNAGDTVRLLVEGKPLPLRLGRLSADQQEIMCSEFLRLPEAETLGLPRLDALVLPTGRTLKDIDILGIATDGRPLCAQVTLSQDEAAHARKAASLRAYATSESHLILFCTTGAPGEREGVAVRSINTLFELFRQTTSGARWCARVFK